MQQLDLFGVTAGSPGIAETGMANGERIILGLAEVLAFCRGDVGARRLSVVAKVAGRLRRYAAMIQGEPGAFGINFPDVPGCVGRGRDCLRCDRAGRPGAPASPSGRGGQSMA